MNDLLNFARIIRRQAPHMDHLWEAVACPFCHAEPGEPCRTRTGNPVDASHSHRHYAFKDALTP